MPFARPDQTRSQNAAETVTPLQLKQVPLFVVELPSQQLQPRVAVARQTHS